MSKKPIFDEIHALSEAKAKHDRFELAREIAITILGRSGGAVLGGMTRPADVARIAYEVADALLEKQEG